MRILILSNTEWDDNNSFGNSFSNIFGGIDDIEIANVYCRKGMPNTTVCNTFFNINEKSLLDNLFNKNKKSGFVVNITTAGSKVNFKNNRREQVLINFIRKKRWILLFWIRDLIWKIGRWKSYELRKFIDDFKPDLIFLPIYYSTYLNKIGLFLKSYTNKPMIGYISDDNYTLRQFSLNPLFWIDRFIKRKWVKRAIINCEELFVISDVQKEDYDKCFSINTRILYKGGDFKTPPPKNVDFKSPLNLVYTGNIGTGRYKVLSQIGLFLEEINNNQEMVLLHIYTATPLSYKMKKHLCTKQSIIIHNPVTHKEILRLQKEADILVHVESFDLKEKLLTRQSFSTKLVDYMVAGKCILAVGWKEAASIKYLQNSQASLVATNAEELKEILISLKSNPEKYLEYGNNIWHFGRKNHQLDNLQSKLQQVMKNTVKNF